MDSHNGLLPQAHQLLQKGDVLEGALVSSTPLIYMGGERFSLDGTEFVSLAQAMQHLLSLKTLPTIHSSYRFWRTWSSAFRKKVALIELAEAHVNSTERNGTECAAAKPYAPLCIQADGLGKILLAPCPGSRVIDKGGYAVVRDFDDDLAVMKGWGASYLLSVLEPTEYTYLGLAAKPNFTAALGYCDHLVLPVKQQQKLAQGLNTLWERVSRRLLVSLVQGQDIVIHCSNTMGRAAYIAAKLLVRHGVPAADAINMVYAAHPFGIESFEQEADILADSLGLNLPSPY
ncbi:hypothetical protein [Agaribacterium haliotis]|uniref:hypothetical protein n=1 Tax=Agaribacterium haliotis TaxID=2013869 RepID=UPI000BB57D9E|nr:hypothetical protein [Agaribacterium haliotis]